MKNSRYALAARLAATQTFINLPTTVTTLLTLPLLELLLLVAVAFAMDSAQLVLTAYCGALLAASTAVLSQSVGLITYNRNIGVLHDVLLTRFFNPVFWFSKMALPCLNAAITGATMILGIWLCSWQAGASLPLTALALLPCFIAAGAALGFACSTLSVALKNPYLISNVLAAALPLTAGVLAPLSAYPTWLAGAVQWLPLTHGIQVYRALATGGQPGPALAADALAELAVCGLWAAAGALASCWVLALIRSGRRQEEIW